jgi:hypothetical protein
MSTNNESTGPVAALMLPRMSKPLLTFARAVHGALLNNPAFPSPNPPLDVFAADIAVFEDAETKAASRAKGAASLRDAKKNRVKADLFHLRDYVQSVVETNTSPATASALIESAFMSVRKVPKRTFPDLSAKNADVSSKVLLTAKAIEAPSSVIDVDPADGSSGQEIDAAPVSDALVCALAAVPGAAGASSSAIRLAVHAPLAR